jgi:hypothetical protein
MVFRKAALTISLVLMTSYLLHSQPIVSFTEAPAHLQLYARNGNNQATVPIAGTIKTTGYTSISVLVLRNNVRWQYLKTNLAYTNGKASFFLFPVIQAGLYEYTFKLFAKQVSDSVLITQQDSITCGDAYIITGQSNARLADDRETYKNEFCRTFGKTTTNGNASPSLLGDTLWSLSEGTGFVNVGVWGINLQRQLIEKNQMPTCLINGGVSQTRIFMHQKDLSNPLYFSDTYYGRIYYRVAKAKLLNGIKALFWYQGESDAGNDFPSYLQSFNQLYFDWHADYPSLQRLYVFQINIGCLENDSSGKFREGQRQFKSTFPDIQTISTVATPYYNGCHYDTAGYHFTAKHVYKLLANDFYGSTQGGDDLSPDIQKAYYTSNSRKEIILEFSNATQMFWQNDTLGKQLKYYFYLDGKDSLISSGYASGNKIRLVLQKPFSAKSISYLPNFSLDSLFLGPYLRNKNKYGAFSFYNFPVNPPPPIGSDPGCPGAFGPVSHIYGTNKTNTIGKSITQNTTWHKDSIYVLHDYVRVATGATLTIEPGTIVMGAPTPSDTSLLIIQKGAKLYANGSSSSPIVFTSCKLQGTRNRGDWGGLVLCGSAPNNVGNNIELEGGYRAFHGGTNVTDNTGSLQYMRVEYAGIKFNSNEETNGLTLASVGNGTNIKYVQVSYSGDDSFEWFGGTVNSRYLISWKTLDDDFDTDLGYRGNNQFGIGFRDYSSADVSGSNGFESDNNSSNPNASPKTAPIFSNFEVWGPRTTASTPYNGFFQSGAYLKNNTEIKLYNSLILGWPGDSLQKKAGLYLDGAGTITNAKIDSIRIRNCVIGSYLPNVLFLSTGSNLDWLPYSSMTSWYYKSTNHDSTSNNILLPQKKAPLRETPLFTVSSTSSPFNRGSSFMTATKPALPQSPQGFFQNVPFRGAMGGTDWSAGWAEFNPNLVIYAANNYSFRKTVLDSIRTSDETQNLNHSLTIAPNPSQLSTKLTFFSSCEGKATISCVGMDGTCFQQEDLLVKMGKNEVEMDIASLPTGIFGVFVKVCHSQLFGRLLKF